MVLVPQVPAFVDHPSFFTLLTAIFAVAAIYDFVFFLLVCLLLTAAVYLDSPTRHRDSFFVTSA
jgi:hypothetical protein